METSSAGYARSEYSSDAAAAASPWFALCSEPSCSALKRPRLKWRDFEDVLVEPVANTTATAAATTTSTETAVSRRRVIGIPLLVSRWWRELYLSGSGREVKAQDGSRARSF